MSTEKTPKARGSRGSRTVKMLPNGKPDPASLSDRQRRILEVIRDAVVLRGYPPSIREIGDAAGLQSTSSVAYQLKELEKKGFLRRDPNKPRAVDVRHLPDTDTRPKVGPKSKSKNAAHSAPNEDLASATSFIPVVGKIAAGNPILAEQNIEEYYPLPAEIVGDGELYMLEVIGESMRDAGILSGDWVVVRSQPVAEQGEFVAAMIDGEATVKEFHKDASGVWLLPHNDSFAPISGENAEIMGKVVSVMRKL
ncbi:MAG: transcriptional repressor LexA [Corynebacterium sp.]|uniref:transcriptional repressor LexA n=1 Tax=uncultured Corynebacterium sp. TaxID=159447 RepID=UPI00182E2AAF|nr:transcriptional repressor LexA [uncultured Corynebacterium sp.]NLZ58552.1 transcriptional repressor LexA [Corynebacterium sp.]